MVLHFYFSKACSLSHVLLKGKILLLVYSTSTINFCLSLHLNANLSTPECTESDIHFSSLTCSLGRGLKTYCQIFVNMHICFTEISWQWVVFLFCLNSFSSRSSLNCNSYGTHRRDSLLDSWSGNGLVPVGGAHIMPILWVVEKLLCRFV